MAAWYRRIANREWRTGKALRLYRLYSLLATRFSPLLTAIRLFSQPLHNRHIGHAAALAHGLQAVALVALLQRVDQRGHQLGAGAAQGMAERDGAAIDVEPRRIGAGRLEPRRRHRREGLVDLEQVDVVDRHAGLLQRAVGRRKRGFQHDHGIAAHHGHVMNPRHRLDAERLQALFVDDHDAGGAVADLAGAGGGELAVLRDQLDVADALEAGVEADAFIDVMGVGRTVSAGDLQRNDLVLELSGLGRGDGTLVALIGVFVEV